ncbi:unnamed protein product [Heligmosomoides polygyrus]|uniref:Uncharacterized protein n=1 Tax=Heligmosomoides polygyrus TaxID=6339 RepID=A0A183GDL2_HELPZ|nr:unnamed protein product [Heligmosomoides polygyrus]
MRNGQVSDAPFSLNGTNISECSCYVYLGREVNMANDLASVLGRRKRAAWGAFRSVEEAVKKTKNVRFRAHLFDSTVLPVPTYASKTWAIRKQDEQHPTAWNREDNAQSDTSVTCVITQVREGIQSS